MANKEDGMKRNNELEAKDLRIDDLEVDDEWQQVIVAYMETWFDVDKKFHLDINSQDGTWLNMTVFFNPYKDTVSILCAIDSDEGYEDFYYEPTNSEAEFIKDMIAQKLQIECDQSPREFCEQYFDEVQEVTQ